MATTAEPTRRLSPNRPVAVDPATAAASLGAGAARPRRWGPAVAPGGPGGAGERPPMRVLPRGDQRVPAPGVQTYRTGMRFDPAMSIDRWKQIGSKIGAHSDATCWWLGDWLGFGRTNYGRRYKEGVALTGLEYKTLRNYAVVARAFESSRRRAELSFQHHAEVCALPRGEQDLWLDLAVRRSWSKAELRRQLREQRRAATATTSTASLHLALEPSRHQRWCDAAEHRDCSLEAWVTTVLDEAARAELEPAAAGDE